MVDGDGDTVSAGFLPAGRDGIFGVLHHPTAPAATAVLQLPPFGWDDVCSYRSRRAWAQDLCARGHPTLRIDLPGSGDSPGSPRDPDRLAAWVAAVEGAAAWLRARTGCARVCALGLGLGGFAGSLAAARDGGVDDLVLWGVPARGRAMLREWRAFAALQAAQLGMSDAVREAGAPGDLWVNGFVLTAQTVAELEAVDLAAEVRESRVSRRVLLLGRDGVPADARLEQAWREAGAEVATERGQGWGTMMAEPQHAVAPEATFAAVGAWLDAAPGAVDRPSPVESVAPLGPVTFMAGGAELTEEALELPLGFGRAFAVLTRPAGTSPTRCVVLGNAGAVRRIGPNRMWVEAARRWAGDGTAVVRLDLEGLGDADGAEGWGLDSGGFYVPKYFGQLREALDALQAHGPERFVLSGLCASAFWSLHVAPEDPRVEAVHVVNPMVLVWDPGIRQARLAATTRKLKRASSLRRLLTGKVSARKMRRIVVAAVRERLAGRRDGVQTTAIEVLDRLAARRIPVTVTFSPDEPLRDELVSAGLVPDPARWPTIGWNLLDGPPVRVHTLTPGWLQRAVHEQLDAAVKAPEPLIRVA